MICADCGLALMDPTRRYVDASGRLCADCMIVRLQTHLAFLRRQDALNRPSIVISRRYSGIFRGGD